jgi:hypothetical protein
MGVPADSLRSDPRRSLAYDLVFFVALLSTTLALGGALAHLLALPNKIDLPRDQYFTVQQIYRGWWQLAYLLAIEFASMVGVIILSRQAAPVFWSAAAALACLIAAQIVFWACTYPANVATAGWTAIPPEWEMLRRQWEYSHAVGAALQMLSMCALIVAVLARARQHEPTGGTP